MRKFLFLFVAIFALVCAGAEKPKYLFLFIGDGMSIPQRMTGEEFAMSLLKSKQVALVHGSAYGGETYKDFVRIAFTMDCQILQEAFRRIREFLEECKNR